VNILCIVIPCYNEGLRLDGQVIDDFLKLHSGINFLLVNDGSTDNTSDLIIAMANRSSGRVEALNLQKNVGKAEAVRQGMMHAAGQNNYKWVAFLDADFSVEPEELLNMLKLAEVNSQLKMIMGSRVLRLGGQIDRNNLRHYLGRIFATIASAILKLPVYDSQCGAKIFQQETLEMLFNEPFLSKWLFDVEILARYRNAKGRKAVLKEVLEFPLNRWVEKGASKLKFIDMVRVPWNFLLIHRKYN